MKRSSLFGNTLVFLVLGLTTLVFLWMGSGNQPDVNQSASGSQSLDEPQTIDQQQTSDQSAASTELKADPDKLVKPKRWAVVCTDDLRETGLSDLLTAKLSGDHEFELVERELLESVTSELEMFSYSDAAASNQRLKLGEMLSADNLILVSNSVVNDIIFLRVVICECELGTRLLDSRTELDGADVAAMANTCESLAIQTRERFKNGIRQIVGVAPFQSTNLSHRFDRYQAGFQNLLQSALLTYPGVAVIEIEEAQAIQNELAISTKRKISRVAMTLVDANFRFEEDPTAPQTCTLELHVKNGFGAEQTKTLGPESVEEIAKSLIQSFPAEVLADQENKPGKLAESAQTKWLFEQAAQFRKRAEWEKSAALTEAALLLAPNDVDLRRQAIHNYLDICIAPCVDREAIRRLPTDDPRAMTVVRERVSAFYAYLAHYEFAIRNRLISANEATSLIRTTDTVFKATNNNNADSIIRKNKIVAGELESVEQDFIPRIKPLVLELSRDFSFQVTNRTIKKFQPIKNESELVSGWNELLFTSVTDRMDRGHFTPNDLNRLHEVIVKEIPDGTSIPNSMMRFFNHERIHAKRFDSMKRRIPDIAVLDDWQAFLKKLSESGNKNANMLANFSNIRAEYRTVRLLRPTPFKRFRPAANDDEEEARYQLFTELDDLMCEYHELPYSTGNRQTDRGGEPIAQNLLYFRDELQASLGLDDPDATTPNQPMFAAPRTPTPKTDSQPKYDYSGAVGVVHEFPVELALKTFEGKLQKPMKRIRNRPNSRDKTDDLAESDAPPKLFRIRAPLGLTRCGEVDVWWTRGSLLVMKEKGLLEEIAVDPDAVFLDVVWDGENAWVATLNGGIRILDLDSKTFSHACDRETGLPLSNAELKIIDIEPGKILAVGSFGKNLRAWCAMIEKKENELLVDIFHEAANSEAGSDGVPDWKDPTVTFYPAWICKFDPGKSQPLTYLIGRARGSHSAENRPLAIEPKSRRVSTDITNPMLKTYGEGGFITSRDSFFTRDGSLIKIGQGNAFHFKPTNGDSDLSAKQPKLEWICSVADALPNYKISPNSFPMIYKYILRGDQLLLPGAQWYQLDPTTLQETRFVSPNPNKVLNVPAYFGESAHYGIIGWRAADASTFRRYELEENDQYAK